MEQYNQGNNNNPLAIEAETPINIQKYIYLILSNWYWFALSLLIVVGSVWIYHRFYAQNVYKADTLLLIEQDNSGKLGNTSVDPGAFIGLGFTTGNNNISNQLEILRSWTHVKKTIEKLDFEVTYIALSGFRETEIYNDKPFIVLWDRSHPQLLGVTYELELLEGNTSANLIISGENAYLYDYSKGKVVSLIGIYNEKKQIEINALVQQQEYSFKIVLTDPVVTNSKYKFFFQSIEALLENYLGALTVSKLNKPNDGSSILTLQAIGSHPQKLIDFLNKLIEVYQSRNLDKKNLIATKTIDFINSQLVNISDSLKISENTKESFQREQKLFDLSTQSNQLLERLLALEDEKRVLDSKNKYYLYLQDYMKKSKDLGNVIAPATMGIED